MSAIWHRLKGNCIIRSEQKEYEYEKSVEIISNIRLSYKKHKEPESKPKKIVKIHKFRRKLEFKAWCFYTVNCLQENIKNLYPKTKEMSLKTKILS